MKEETVKTGLHNGALSVIEVTVTCIHRGDVNVYKLRDMKTVLGSAVSTRTDPQAAHKSAHAHSVSSCLLNE